MNDVTVGDRASWYQRDKGPILTGTVREIKLHDGLWYAIVATDPDERLCMPALDRLTRLVRAKERAHHE